MYLRSSCCLLFGILTVSWLFIGHVLISIPYPNYQHIKGTTQSSPRTCSELNKELSHFVQLIVIKGNGTHCLSLVLVSSQLGHTLSRLTSGAEYEHHSFMSFYYLPKLMWDTLIDHLGLWVEARHDQGMIDTCMHGRVSVFTTSLTPINLKYSVRSSGEFKWSTLTSYTCNTN